MCVATATAGVALSYDVIFKSGSSDGDKECVNVTIMDNSVLGVDKTLALMLTTSDPSVKVANHFTTITILANSKCACRFAMRYIVQPADCIIRLSS